MYVTGSDFFTVLIILGGNVKTNPGPPRSQKERTLSFAETASSPSTYVTLSVSQVHTKRTIRATTGLDSEVLSLKNINVKKAILAAIMLIGLSKLENR